jgi:hypothetical protein
MTLRVYQLNEHEEKLINALNRNRVNVLMIVCEHGNSGPVLEMDDLESGSDGPCSYRRNRNNRGTVDGH